MKRGILCLGSAISVALVLAPVTFGGVPAFTVAKGFNTPSRNIVCNAGPLLHGSGYALACVVFSASGSRGQKTWYMRQTGRAAVTFVRANAATDFPHLAYGRSWIYHGFTCTSRVTGLRCRNESGHGFFLSREKQLLF
jgi:hypothetical protein